MNFLFQNLKLIVLFQLMLFMLDGCILVQPSVKKHTKRAFAVTNQYDAVIVPGVPFIAPSWDLTMKMRVLWAVNLYKKGITKKLIMSGSSVYSPYVEAQIMKLYAVKLGVPEQDIILEERAQHSTENIWYGYKLAAKLGYDKIALATDPFQTRMTYRFGKRRLKKLQYLPVIFDTLKTIEHSEPEIDHQSVKLDSFVPITETQSFWYRFRGTMGKHINFKE